MLVLDQAGDMMFLPNTGSNTVTMVEGALAGPARATLTDIPVPGERPEGIDLSPDGRELGTATRGDGGVSIIDVASRRVVETLDLGLQDANRLKFTPDGRVLIGVIDSAVVLVGWNPPPAAKSIAHSPRPAVRLCGAGRRRFLARLLVFETASLLGERATHRADAWRSVRIPLTAGGNDQSPRSAQEKTPAANQRRRPTCTARAGVRGLRLRERVNRQFQALAFLQAG